MIKRVLAGVVAGLLALSATAPLAAQRAGTPARPAATAAGAKIGFIDSRQILAAAPGSAAADSTFTKELAGLREQVQKLQTTYDSAQTAYDQSAVVLSPSQRDAKQKELAALRERSEQQAQQLQEQAARRRQELFAPIEQRINTAVEAVRAEGGFALIFDVGAPGSAVVAADKTLDLTQRVLQRLQTAK